MSFADPTAVLLGATVTPSGGTSTSYATQDRSAPYTGKYGTSDGLNRLRITHTLGSKKRSEFRLEQDKSYTDPTTGLVSTITVVAYLVVNRPNAGFTNAEIKSLMAGVTGFCGVSGNQDKILGLES